MKNFKNYTNYSNNLTEDEYKKFLLGFSYINEYSKEIKNGLNIKKIDGIKSFNKTTYKNLKQIDLTYSTLFQFYLYAWLYAYKGRNNKIINIINTNDNLILRTVSQIPFNLITLKKIRKYVNITNTYEKDYKLLSEFISKKDQIINEANFIEWFDIVYRNTIKANYTEYVVQQQINSNKIRNISNAKTVPSFYDMNGVDLKATDNNGNDKKIQVKGVAAKSRLVVDYKKNEETEKYNYVIAIYNTQLDLRNYTAKTDTLKYDYLYLYMEKKPKKIIVIDINAINSIRIFGENEGRIIYINIEDNITKENIQEYIKSYIIKL
jgi:hypothetical protein